MPRGRCYDSLLGYDSMIRINYTFNLVLIYITACVAFYTDILWARHAILRDEHKECLRRRNLHVQRFANFQIHLRKYCITKMSTCSQAIYSLQFHFIRSLKDLMRKC